MIKIITLPKLQITGKIRGMLPLVDTRFIISIDYGIPFKALLNFLLPFYF